MSTLFSWVSMFPARRWRWPAAASSRAWQVATRGSRAGCLVSRLLGLRPALAVMDYWRLRVRGCGARCRQPGLAVAVGQPARRRLRPRDGRAGQDRRVGAKMLAAVRPCCCTSTPSVSASSNRWPTPSCRALHPGHKVLRRRQLDADDHLPERQRMRASRVAAPAWRQAASSGSSDRTPGDYPGRADGGPMPAPSHAELAAALASVPGIGCPPAWRLLRGGARAGQARPGAARRFALVGVAPLGRGSGRMRGQRSIWADARRRTRAVWPLTAVRLANPSDH